jgi:hypothetical protein
MSPTYKHEFLFPFLFFPLHAAGPHIPVSRYHKIARSIAACRYNWPDNVLSNLWICCTIILHWKKVYVYNQPRHHNCINTNQILGGEDCYFQIKVTWYTSVSITKLWSLMKQWMSLGRHIWLMGEVFWNVSLITTILFLIYIRI